MQQLFSVNKQVAPPYLFVKRSNFSAFFETFNVGHTDDTYCTVNGFYEAPDTIEIVKFQTSSY